jgi:hypothetical protein
LRPNEPVPGRKGAPSLGGAAADWLDDQAAIEITQDACTRRLPRFRVRFHDDEEIGPVMMARIAKRTGLTPDDL